MSRVAIQKKTAKDAFEKMSICRYFLFKYISQ